MTNTIAPCPFPTIDEHIIETRGESWFPASTPPRASPRTWSMPAGPRPRPRPRTSSQRFPPVTWAMARRWSTTPTT